MGVRVRDGARISVRVRVRVRVRVGVRVHTWCEAGTESVSYSSTRSEVVSW